MPVTVTQLQALAEGDTVTLKVKNTPKVLVTALRNEAITVTFDRLEPLSDDLGVPLDPDQVTSWQIVGRSDGSGLPTAMVGDELPMTVALEAQYLDSVTVA